MLAIVVGTWIVMLALIIAVYWLVYLLMGQPLP
jgi:hypothetical protein